MFSAINFKDFVTSSLTSTGPDDGAQAQRTNLSFRGRWLCSDDDDPSFEDEFIAQKMMTMAQTVLQLGKYAGN
jgi:hypothetical protein